LLARITPGEHGAVTPAAMRRYQAIAIRHTDRRPVIDTPVPPEVLLPVATAAQDQGASLHVLRRDQVIELASAASYAQETELRDEAFRAELAYWAGGTRPGGAGVPAAAIPERRPATTVPERDFGQVGTLP